MSKITYLDGNATEPVDNKGVIVHVTNDQGGWGSGFVVALSSKWKEPEIAYRLDELLELSRLQIVKVDKELYVCNMCAQHEYATKAKPCALSYTFLGYCLAEAARFCKRKQLNMVGPKFGAGLAGGDWKKIEKIIQQEVCGRGVDVDIYNFVPVKESVGVKK